MKYLLIILALMALLVGGCADRSTTVILVPSTDAPPGTSAATAPVRPTETAPATSEATEATSPSTQPSVSATTESRPTQKPTEPPTTEPTEYDIASHRVGTLEYAILEELNRYRDNAGLPGLDLSKTLSALAHIRADECSIRLSHTRPDGRNWNTVLSDHGRGGGLGENILYGNADYSADKIVSTWMQSDSHKALILHPEADTVGIGICRSGGKIYIACLFTG